jgi:methionine aminopeptidase
MKSLSAELWDVGLAATINLPEDPGLTTQDVDAYADEYALTLNKAQAFLGYRPFNPTTGETF